MIPVAIRESYDNALHCNGNGACYNWDPDDAMCPSWKGTRERRHSPKGRASADARVAAAACGRGCRSGRGERRLRATSGLAHAAGPHPQHAGPSAVASTTSRTRSRRPWTAASRASPASASARSRSTCPPSARSSSSSTTAATCARCEDYVVGAIEHLLPVEARMPGLYNLAVGSPPGQLLTRRSGSWPCRRLSGLRLDRELAARGIRTATPQALAALSAAERARSVVVVQDAFTSYYETPLLLDLLDLLAASGLPALAGAVPAERQAAARARLPRPVRARGRRATPRCCGSWLPRACRLVGLDPSMTLPTGPSTRRWVPTAVPKVQLVQEWLASSLDELPELSWLPGAGTASFSCRTAPSGPTRRLARRLAARLPPARPRADGPAERLLRHGRHLRPRGTAPHHLRADLRAELEGEGGHHGHRGRLLATGYSCRSQVKIIDGIALRHPAQALRIVLLGSPA